MNNLFDATRPYTDLAGRVLIASLFVLSGWSKIGSYAAMQGYMQSVGVPGALLPLVIAVEVGGGLAVIAGFYTRVAALLLAGFSILAALLFHAGSHDQIQQIMFLKNLGLAGGFLFLVANGAGPLSVEHWLHRPQRA
jgi:putative oxidoreductase